MSPSCPASWSRPGRALERSRIAREAVAEVFAEITPEKSRYSGDGRRCWTADCW